MMKKGLRHILRWRRSEQEAREVGSRSGCLEIKDWPFERKDMGPQSETAGACAYQNTLWLPDRNGG